MAPSGDDLTRTSGPDEHVASGHALDSGRFIAGTILTSRYRVVGLLGRGGMGEVYKAEDLRLGQTVALKFLPKALTNNAAALARFQQEVRIARKVSHPNVCRVYDLVDCEAGSFLTMEFIDGEDLASLLKRIGRLPADKATEVARQIVAGLAAAHDQNVLHRDLKPANVMIDGRGRARLTDFGLATAVEAAESDARVAGTVPYMAPELLAGGAATVSSDLFSLGLVLYELFTAKRAFESTGLLDLKREYAESPVKTPSSWITDLDPLVESAVMRCLEHDPARRPTSALRVLVALPGGDPLQAALLAGETPSPAAVAAAGSREAMPVSSALWWVAALTAGVMALAILTPRLSVSIQSGTLPPDALEARGRAIMTALGYVKPPFEAWNASLPDAPYQLHVRLTAPRGEGWNRLLHERPHPDISHYRESPERLVPLAAKFVRSVDPPLAPGMSYLRMDGLGRLKRVEVVPYAWDASSPVGTGADWPAAFHLAGLNVADFTAVPPERTPPHASDTRVAWTGRYPGQKDEIRIEAAAYRGRVVFFETIEAWELPTEGQAPSSPLTLNPIVSAGLIVALVIVILGSLVLSWRNYQSGRGDRRGAWRLGAVVFVGNVAGAIVGEWPGVMGKGALLWLIATRALESGVLTGLLYFAVEPYVRRWWPTTIITWSRLLAGEWRDPLVGRDVLIGTTVGVLLWVLSAVHAAVEVSAGNATFSEFWTLSAREAVGGVLQLTTDTEFTLGGFLLFALARAMLRRTWLAAVVLWLLMTVPGISRSPLDMVVFGISAAIYLWITARWGLLVVLVGAFHIQPVLTFDPRQWYFGGSTVYLLFLAACAWYGFRTATAGRPVVSPRWLEG